MRRLIGFWLVMLAAAGTNALAQIDMTDPTLGGVNGGLVKTWSDIPFRNVLRQKYDYSCGAAALATLLHYHYKLDVDEARVFRAMFTAGDQDKIRKIGFSLLDMKRYLATIGLSADGYRATYDELKAGDAPAIAVLNVGTYPHFVVIKGVRGDKVLIGDPALGLKIYSRAQFERMWNHIVFVIHGAKGQTVAYNRDSEWRPGAVASLGQALEARDLGNLGSPME